MDKMYIYIKTTWENVKFQILFDYTQLKRKENIKKNIFYCHEQAISPRFRDKRLMLVFYPDGTVNNVTRL